MEERTYWNGIPTEATRGTAIVSGNPDIPKYWARIEGILGQRISVVCVEVRGSVGVIYLDNRDGSGWTKVTQGHGSPGWGHKNVTIVAGSFEEEK